MGLNEVLDYVTGARSWVDVNGDDVVTWEELFEALGLLDDGMPELLF